MFSNLIQLVALIMNYILNLIVFMKWCVVLINTYKINTTILSNFIEKYKIT